MGSEFISLRCHSVIGFSAVRLFLLCIYVLLLHLSSNITDELNNLETISSSPVNPLNQRLQCGIFMLQCSCCGLGVHTSGTMQARLQRLVMCTGGTSFHMAAMWWMPMRHKDVSSVTCCGGSFGSLSSYGEGQFMLRHVVARWSEFVSHLINQRHNRTLTIALKPNEAAGCELKLKRSPMSHFLNNSFAIQAVHIFCLCT